MGLPPETPDCETQVTEAAAADCPITDSLGNVGIASRPLDYLRDTGNASVMRLFLEKSVGVALIKELIGKLWAAWLIQWSLMATG